MVRALMPPSRRFGSVTALEHAGCSQGCRELCFEAQDPEHRVVRLTHGVWRAILAKQNRAQMGDRLGDVQRAVLLPRLIQADPLDAKTLLYYFKPDAGRDKLLLVAVKCLPRRFSDGLEQGRYLRLGGIVPGWGEAWVASAYFVKEPKRRARAVWPS
jgi:hypothetical protein